MKLSEYIDNHPDYYDKVIRVKYRQRNEVHQGYLIRVYESGNEWLVCDLKNINTGDIVKKVDVTLCEVI